MKPTIEDKINLYAKKAWESTGAGKIRYPLTHKEMREMLQSGNTMLRAWNHASPVEINVYESPFGTVELYIDPDKADVDYDLMSYIERSL